MVLHGFFSGYNRVNYRLVVDNGTEGQSLCLRRRGIIFSDSGAVKNEQYFITECSTLGEMEGVNRPRICFTNPSYSVGRFVFLTSKRGDTQDFKMVGHLIAAKLGLFPSIRRSVNFFRFVYNTYLLLRTRVYHIGRLAVVTNLCHEYRIRYCVL